MIANKSIKLTPNYPPTSPYPVHDPINTSFQKNNQIDTSQRIPTSIERVCKNLYQSPLSRFSQ